MIENMYKQGLPRNLGWCLAWEHKTWNLRWGRSGYIDDTVYRS